MTNVIAGKFSAQLPNPDGGGGGGSIKFGPVPANQGLVCFLIGARSNHPLGVLAPGLKELGDHQRRLQEEVDVRADEYGLVASSAWLAAERPSGNEFLNVMYFRSVEGLHRFAHDDLHRDAWAWWNRTFDRHPHISIWHEVFAAPAGAWEAIYVNSHPTLLAGGQVPVKTGAGTVWSRLVVDASRGPLSSSRGRMNATDGTDNEKHGSDPYVHPARLPDVGKPIMI
jgi:hypothetical protein